MDNLKKISLTRIIHWNVSTLWSKTLTNETTTPTLVCKCNACIDFFCLIKWLPLKTIMCPWLERIPLGASTTPQFSCLSSFSEEGCQHCFVYFHIAHASTFIIHLYLFLCLSLKMTMFEPLVVLFNHWTFSVLPLLTSRAHSELGGESLVGEHWL